MVQNQERGRTERSGTTGDVLSQTRAVAGDTASTVSEYAQSAYGRSADFVRQQRQRHPEVDRYLQQGTQYVRAPVQENPLLAVLVAGALGYGLAYLIHASLRRREAEGVPDYARTRTHYRWGRG